MASFGSSGEVDGSMLPLMDRLEYDVQTITPTPGYDSASARSTRADTVDRSGFDQDIAESAMVTDLGSGPPSPR